MYNKQVLHIPNTKEQRHTTTTIEHIVETKYHKSTEILQVKDNTNKKCSRIHTKTHNP